MSSTNGTDSRMPRTTISRGNFGQTRLILIGAAVLLSLGMGMRQSLGLFLAPVTRDLALAADFTLAVAIQNIVWGVSQAPIGAIADRFGLRATMMAGAAIYVLGLGLMAASGGALSLFVSGGFIGVALSCTASSLALTACARAVSEERRSKMLGVVAAAGSLGTLLVPLITQSLLVHQTWQIGVLFFAILAAVMLPAAFWAGAADRLPGSGVAKATMREMLGQAARHRPFLVMSGAYFVCGLNREIGGEYKREQNVEEAQQNVLRVFAAEPAGKQRAHGVHAADHRDGFGAQHRVLPADRQIGGEDAWSETPGCPRPRRARSSSRRQSACCG
jgi:hypothetical protein